MLAALLLIGQFLLQRVGELDLDRVIAIQVDGKADALYLGGFNQRFYRYKEKLLNRIDPVLVTVGSSRAMQVRGEFFSVPFTNLGGSVNSVGELEAISRLLTDRRIRRGPRATVLFVDPWWFNSRFAGTGGTDIVPPAPEVITFNMAMTALSRLTRGNWIERSLHSPDLGIHSLLTGNGFSRDGSFHYTALAAGRATSADLRFERTLATLEAGDNQFRRTTHVDAGLMERACIAISRLKSATRLTIVIPPFAPPVARRLASPDYAYLPEVTERIRSCSQDVKLFDFSLPEAIPDATDCEFVDGLHGGDVVYARMLKEMVAADPLMQPLVKSELLDTFIRRHAGHAAAVTTERSAERIEVDFLRLGCRK